MSETMIAQLSQRADEMVELLRELLLTHSSLADVNRPDSGVVFVGASYAWAPLEAEARRLQSRLLNELEWYAPLVEALVRVAPERARKEVAEANETVREAVDQSAMSWFTTPEEAFGGARDGIEKQKEHLASLYDPTNGDPMYVVDASAAMWNPDFDDWVFEDARTFVLLITPTLLAELDKLKIAPREEVRGKAEAVVNRVNEYGRRGAGRAAVTLRRDRSSVRMIAVEPNFSQTLPWLDPSVQDDRLIASTLEIIRQHPQSPVTIVTRDGNMQNKARHAAIPFVEPPEPPPPKQRRSAPPTDRGDARIVELKSTGGSPDAVTFAALVWNYGAGPTRATVRASVADQDVDTAPQTLNLLVGAEPTAVRIRVPRPSLGDLMAECNHETTLYGQELALEVVAGGRVTTETWREHVYDAATERARHDVQQRYWRLGRGDATEADLRAEARATMIARHVNRRGNDLID
jgi:hypothetical protein